MTSEYTIAIHAISYLYHKQTTVSSIELAENICTNPARIRKVMLKLKNAGLILATRGKGSGYKINNNMQNLTLDKILLAIDEPVVSLDWKSGSIDKQCLISSGMANIMQNIYTQLNEKSMEVLQKISIQDINNTLFSTKGE